MFWRLAIIFSVLLTISAAYADSPALKTYRDQKNGISFDYPASLIQMPCEENCIGFKEPKEDDEAFRVEFQPLNLDQALAKNGCFEKTGDRWITAQCGMATPGEETIPLVISDWSGLYSTRSCGITDEAGYHAGLGNCVTIFLNKNNKTIIFSTDGVIDTQEFLDQIVHSFKSIP